MNKELYLQELRKGLKILPQFDRDEAVEFYEEYFDEAGVENEQNVIAELGEPKILAKKILVDVVDRKYEESLAASSSENALVTVPSQPIAGDSTNDAVVAAPVVSAEQAGAQYTADGAQFAANGAQGATVPQYQPQPQAQQQKTSSLKALWIVLAAIFALPLSPVIFALLIVACTLIFVLFVVLITFVIVGVSFLVSGFVMAICGFVAFFLNPIAAMVILGSGLVLFGLGVFFTIGSIALMRVCANGLAKGFGRIVHKKNRKNKAAQAMA